MSQHLMSRTVATAAGIALFAACSDTTAPTPHTLRVHPLAAVSGGPDLSDFHNFTGELWSCVDAGTPGTGFAFKWKIVDNASHAVVSSGVKLGVSVGECVFLDAVPTNIPGRYTATVIEDPGGAGGVSFQISSIDADYGANFPPPAPTASPNVPGRRISSLMTHDFGVQFTFFH